MTGGALGYVSYDCVKYFEPKTKRDMKDILELPESLFMMCDTIVAFDHFFQTIKVITHMHLAADAAVSAADYEAATKVIESVVATLRAPGVPLPEQPPIVKGHEYVSTLAATATRRT